MQRSIKKGGRFGLEAPVDEPSTSDATSGHFNLTGSRMRGVQQWTNTSSSLANTGEPIHPQVNPIGVAPEVPILIDAEGSDELDGEELEITTLIQKTRIQSTSLSPAKASTTTNGGSGLPSHLNLQIDPQSGHQYLPPTPPILNDLWPALLETECLQNLNQSLTTVATGISLETPLIRRRCIGRWSNPYFLKLML
ncbi:hypothetical protein O181_012982 [Austropuccinia psidii MF-1]|uniref:Uncharacterized protein n=1 Tax=Austropuccinia psidii MF-1 TaxID=1389203 RepID=A0A9Q3BYR0_9BASI|nr:hypothetical protein [Austropuccinia psidii MF-1]